MSAAEKAEIRETRHLLLYRRTGTNPRQGEHLSPAMLRVGTLQMESVR